MNEYTYQGMTADEWETLANPQPATDKDLQNLGMLETPQENTQQQPSTEEPKEGNKLYQMADKVGLEHPDEGKEYQKLSLLDTAKDIGTSVGVEAAHLFQKKEDEWRYESKTRVGEFFKYLYRYGAGTASLFVGGGEIGAAIKGISLLNKANKGVKIGSAIQKIFTGTDLIKTGKNAGKLKQLGAKIANNSFGGLVSGAIADFTLYRQEEEEGHLADVFGDTDNPIIGYLQTKEDDTELEGRFKNAIEGIILSPIIGNAAEFVAKPLFGNALKNLKKLKTAIGNATAGKATAEEVQQAAADVALDEIKIEKYANKQDLVDKVKEIKNEAEVAGEEASQLIIDKLDIKDVPEAQKMLQTLEKGEDIFVHEDGTWDISINNWEDAYKVSLEEYNKQLLARDKAKAGMFGDSPVREGDTALEHQNEAIKSTWTNRGWIGENEELTAKNSNKIAKNYKDKWQIDNNIKVEFVDGLKVKGQAVDGNTSATKYLGKSKTTKKTLQNKIDKKQLQIEKIEDKIQKLQDKEYTPDVMGQLQEELRIAQNELKELKNTTPNKETISDITIQIDKNAQNPYATLRAELEHARDIAKGTVPNQTEAHFSRYNGLNEAEVAPSYTYKKSKGRAEALDSQNFMKDGQIPENEVKYNQENTNGQRTSTTSGNQKEEAVRRFIEGATGHNDSGSYEAGLFVQRDNLWIVNDTKANLFDDAKISKTSYKQLDNTVEAGQQFADALSNAKKNLGADGENVDVHFAEDYANTKTFLSEDGLAGVAVTKDGEIISLFVDPTAKVAEGRGRGRALIELAKQNGGTHLNCYNVGLPELYKQHGFTETQKIKWNDDFWEKEKWHKELHSEYSNGEPDIVFMELPKKTTDPSSMEQLQIDFNAKLSETSTPEDAINKVINGEIQPKTEADIEALINKTIDNDVEISGFKWENVAEDSENFSKHIEDLVEKGEDISAYKEAYLTGDVEALNTLSRKEMAATKTLSILADKLEQLGMEAPIEQQRNIIDMVVHISNYVDNIRSGAGRLLNEQKLVNRALDTFGSMRLSQLTKEGITEFSDLLLKDIKESFNLKFTKGQVLNAKEIKQELYSRIFKYGDGEFVDIISSDEVFAKNFNEVLDKLIQTKGDIGVDDIYKELENLITKTQYQDAYNAALLAPKSEGKISVIKNWAGQQGGIASYYVHNLLSGVGSLLKNIISGGLNTIYFPARKILGGYMGGGEAMTKEGWNTYKVLKSNWDESWQMMREAFLKGEGKLSNIGTDTLNMKEGMFQGFHDWDDGDLWHTIQNFHSVMTRAMGATDEFMSQLNYRSICRAKALNQADKMAELAGKTSDENWINETADSLFKKKFDKNGKPLDVDAYNEAKTILYQNKLDGTQFDPRTGQDVQMREQTVAMKVGSLFQELSNKYVLAKFMLPFVKTGTNILQMNLDHNLAYLAGSDFINYLSKGQKSKLLAKTPEGALTRAQAAFGIFSFLGASMIALNGGITGSAPTDPKERKALFETGWKPYSIKWGNKYYSYQGYEPLHTILGFAADSTNLILQVAKSSDEEKFQIIRDKGMATLINNFIDKAAFRTGLKQLVVLTDPEKVVDLEKAAAQTVKGLLPDAAMVQGFSTFGTRDAKTPRTFADMVRNYYGNRGLGEYRRDVFGDKQDIFNCLLFTSSTYGTEPEYQELSRLAEEYGYNPSEISNVISDSDSEIKLRNYFDKETGRSAYDYMQEELSQVVIGGKTLREAVRELIESDYYQSLDDGDKKEDSNGKIKWDDVDTKMNLLNDLFREYNDIAKQNIINGDREFVNKKGNTIKEAQEALRIKKQNQQLSNNLSDSLQKIISIG